MFNLILVGLVSFLVTTQEGGVNVLVPLSISVGGASAALVGTIYGMGSAFQLISRPPAGAFYTPRRGPGIVLGALVALGVSDFGMALARGRLPFVGLYALHGVSFGVATTALLALCMDVMPAGSRAGEVMGWYMAAISAGYATGSFLAGAGGQYGGLPLAYRLSGGETVLALLCMLSIRSRELPQLVPGAKPAGLSRGRGRRRLVLRGLTLPVLVATVIAFYVNFFNDMVDALFPVWAMSVGYGPAVVGMVKGAKSVGSTVIRLAAGPLLRFFNFRVVNIVSLAVLALAVAAVPLTAVPAMLVALFVLQGLGRGMARVTSATLMAEGKGDAAASGAASGWYNAGLDLGATVGPAAGGIVAAFSSIGAVLMALPTLFLGVYAGLELALRRHERRLAVVRES